VRPDQSSIPEVFGLVAELALALGVENIKSRPGLWVHPIDGNWTVAVNAHNEPIVVAPPYCGEVEVPPYSMAIWWHGWIAGMLNAGGGEMAAHPDPLGANEDRLIADLKAAIAKAGARA